MTMKIMITLTSWRDDDNHDGDDDDDDDDDDDHLDKLGPSLRGGGIGEAPASGVDPEL